MNDLVGEEGPRIDWGSDTEILDDVARHGLADGRIVKHSIQIGRVPERGVAHRSRRRKVVLGLAQRRREQQIPAAIDRVEPTKAGRGRHLRGGILGSSKERIASLLLLKESLEAILELIRGGSSAGGQNPHSKARELWHACGGRDERCAEFVAKGLDVEVRRTTFNADQPAMVAHLSGMTGGTGKADPLALPVWPRRPIELTDGKADRQATRICCAR